MRDHRPRGPARLHTLLMTFALLTLASRARAAVTCDDPDNLCTGNPCVIETLTVATPCEVDFGFRTLEIAGVVSVPDGGTLSFTAEAIRLLGRIDGRNVGTGAAVTLVAGAELETEGKIDVGGGAGGGSVALHGGGGGLVIKGKIRANSKLGPGGSVNLSSGGFTSSQQSIDVRGTTGGSIATQTGFMQVFGGVWDARGVAGSGGSVTVSGELTHFSKTIDVRGHGGDGGTVTVSGYLAIPRPGKVLAGGSANGGTINVFGTLSAQGKLIARGKSGNGGTLVASAPDPFPDGAVGFSRTKVDLRGGAGGGLVQIDADSIGFDSFQLQAGGQTGPGEIRMHQSGTFAAEMSGTLDVRDSGIIEVLAPNADLTVSGKFLAGPAGCVGVSAGGVLDTSGLISDVPLAPNCP